MQTNEAIANGFPVSREETQRIELALLLYHDATDLHLFFLDEDLFTLLGRAPAGGFRLDVLALLFRTNGTREIFTVEGASSTIPVDPESGRRSVWWREQVAVARAHALTFCAELAARYPKGVVVVTNPLEVARRPEDSRLLAALA
ncbi:MAG: hypothetical protein HYZ53_02575 [Planctomycetes bacterium]|nr:hypothetical protein [Planctomycetota bacterium]